MGFKCVGAWEAEGWSRVAGGGLLQDEKKKAVRKSVRARAQTIKVKRNEVSHRR